MNKSTKALYAIGFAVAVFGLGFGIFIEYDQFRLFLALTGFTAFVLTVSIGTMSITDEKYLKSVPLAKLEEARPDLQIVKKAMLIDEPEKQEDHVIPRRVKEFPIDCAKCDLLISPQMKEVVIGDKHYHEDCWNLIKPKVADQV